MQIDYHFYFHVVLFIMLFKLVLPSNMCMKPVTLVRESYQAALSCSSLSFEVQGAGLKYGNETLVCDHSNESY